MVFLNPNRTETSEELYRKGRSTGSSRSYERFQAIALIKEGNQVKDVAKVLKRSYQTILNWVTIYNDLGVEGLVYKPSPGPTSWLSDGQKGLLKKAVQLPPEESGISGIQWTYRQVIEFCGKEFKLAIKKRTAIKYLNELGFVRKRPKQHYTKADPEKKSFSRKTDRIREQ